MYQPIKYLPDEKFWKLMKAIFEYQENWNELKLDMDLKIAFWFFKNQFDIDNNKYLEICKKRQEQGKKWGLAKASKSYQTLANSSKSYQTLANSSKSSLKDKDKDKDNKIYIWNFSKKEVELEIEKFINHRNKVFGENRKITDKLKEAYLSMRKKYSKEDFSLGYKWYCINKKWVTDKKLMLEPLTLITQSNW